LGGTLGLRVDVDTYRGTRLGVPALCRILGRHGIRASFFFSVGPDNMGRHLRRLLRPRFALKMLRTRASKLYGWDVLLRGTLWPGPVIGKRLPGLMRATAAAGHEVGLHAWDHHHWQSRIDRLEAGSVGAEIRKGLDLLSRAAGAPISCTAAPAWRCTDDVLKEKALLRGLRYNSDCRGEGIFLPRVGGETLGQPQVPVNLPTYDEAVGRDGVTEASFGDLVISRLTPSGYNVLAAHAEVEGIAAAARFDEFLGRVIGLGYRIVPLGLLVEEAGGRLPVAPVVRGEIPGREGWISLRG